MNLDGPQLLGLGTMAAVALVLMTIGLRRQPRAIWLFSLALLIVGMGYLATTNAPTDLARMLYGSPA
jgi:hypothetical protein